jgi:hypothetical protein
VLPVGGDIVHAAIASDSALFLTAGGRVLALGFNGSGQLLVPINTIQIPEVVPNLENVSGVVMGVRHSLVYCGTGRITYPAMQKDRKYSPESACNFLLSSGLCLGDVVLAGGETGFISTATSRVFVTTPTAVAAFPLTQVKFLTRRGHIGIDHGGAQLEGGRLLERMFGVQTGEIVRGARGIVAVVGLRGKDLVLRGEKGDEIVFSGTVAQFYREYAVVCSWRNIEEMSFSGVRLPVERGRVFFGRYKRVIVRVVGRFAAFYVADDGCKFGLYRDSKLVPLAGREGFFQLDRARAGSEVGTVVAIVGENALFKTDGMRTCKTVRLAGLEVVATLAGEAEVGGISVSARAAKSARFLPGDLFVGESGLLTIVGFRGEAVVARDSGGGLIEIDEKMKVVLVCRELPWGREKLVLSVDGEVVEVSQLATDIENTGFRQGDEVEIAGKRGFVVGCDEAYVWILTDDGKLFCTSDRLEE